MQNTNRRYAQTAKYTRTNVRMPGMADTSDHSEKQFIYQEINFLQQKRRTMQLENAELKAKIQRIRNMADDPDKYPTSQKHSNDADKEVEKINEMIKKKRAKIKATQESDMAGHISELRHESVTYYLEVKRQKQLKIENERNLEAIKQQLKEVEMQISNDHIKAMQKQLKDLTNKSADLARKNQIIQKRLQEKDDAVSQPNEGDEEAQRIVQQLQQEIQKEEKELAEINKEIQELQSQSN